MFYDILFSELFTFLFQESYCIKFSRVFLVDFKTVIYHWLLKAYLAGVACTICELIAIIDEIKGQISMFTSTNKMIHKTDISINWISKNMLLDLFFIIKLVFKKENLKKISKQENAVTVMTNIIHMIISLILHWFYTRSKKNHYQYFIQQLLGFICKYTKRVIVLQVIKILEIYIKYM